MTMQVTHWLEYGDPIDGEQAVEATHRISYETGPNDSREDEVREGVLTFDGLTRGWGENDEKEHVHEDGSLLLSALDDDEREAVMAEFTPLPVWRLQQLDVREAEWEIVAEKDADVLGDHQEWEWTAEIRVRIEHPELRDIVAIKSYRARPKFDDITSEPGHVHEHVKYWFADDYPSQGDTPFKSASHSWDVDYVDDDAALFGGAKAAATADPQAELEMLVYDRQDDERRAAQILA